MATVEEFRDRAALCLDSAKKAVDAKSKLELLGIAIAWLDLADLVERPLPRFACRAEQQGGSFPTQDRSA